MTKVCTLSLTAFAMTIGLGAQSPVGIKETARLTVSGSMLSQPVEITDLPVLVLSNVYAGTFIAAPAAAPDAALARYTVTFDVQTGEGVKLAAYVVQYSMNRSTGEGFVYLPGRGEDSYRRNTSTILRNGLDGTWHRASDEWSAAISAQLPPI